MRYLLTLLLGAAIGAGLIFYFFVGLPRAGRIVGAPVQQAAAGAPPAGTALLTLDENFFNALLTTIFRDLDDPKFQLAGAGGGDCANQVTIIPEGSNVKTGVRVADGKVLAPLAFQGTYNVLGSCLNFRGAGQANLQFSFDPAQQTLYGQINVEGVNLEGVNPLASGFVTIFVQRAINERVNPLPILRAQQLALNVPVQAAGGALKAQVRDVRSEVIDNALRLHINYDFAAAAGGAVGPIVN